MRRYSAADLYGYAVVRERVAWAMLLVTDEDSPGFQALLERWQRTARELARCAARLSSAAAEPRAPSSREDRKPRLAGRLTLGEGLGADPAARVRTTPLH